MTLKSDAKFEEKLTCLPGKWHEEFCKFSPDQSTQKYQNWNFGKMLLSKVENV